MCWFAGLMGKTTCKPSVWCSKYLFFHKILRNSLQNPFQFFYFSFFYRITKMKLKTFECSECIRNFKKDTWNVRCYILSVLRIFVHSVSCHFFLSKIMQLNFLCEITTFTSRFLSFDTIFFQHGLDYWFLWL